MAQEPTNLTREQDERMEIEFCNILIKSDNPRLVAQGRRRLMRVRLRRLKAEELDELSAYLLCERRKRFIKKVEEINNGLR